MTKALVVDGDQLNLELELEILDAAGFTAEGAQDGAEVIKKIDTEIYDLILTEIRLYGMDGIELRKIIKSKPVYKRVPVIALTAYAMKGDKERFLSAGFD
ncbi:MAG: response regulator, partial [Candidatus Methanoperedens sp.]|nr:response regulator [Candidatus Methanoperedens sp.]